jgi:hypothetical protein
MVCKCPRERAKNVWAVSERNEDNSGIRIFIANRFGRLGNQIIFLK